MKTTIDGVEFFSDRNDSRALVAYNTPEGAETLEDAKFIAEKRLESYIEQEPENGYWSIEIESKDGYRVEVSWSFEGCSSDGDEFITTYVNGERLCDKNLADNMRLAYRIGDAKELLSSIDDEEWQEIGIAWFNERIADFAARYPDRFTQEQREEVKRISDVIKQA